MLQSNNIPDDILIEILKFYQPNFIESLKPISSRFNRLICKHFHRVYIPTLVIEISFDNAILIRVARLEGTLISDQCLSTYLNPRFRIHSMEIVYSDPSINSLNESFLRLRAVGGLFSGSVQKMHIRGQIRKSIIAFPDEFFANIFDFLIPNSSEFRLGIRLIQFNFNANSENENGPMILWEKIVSYLHRNLSCGIIRLEIEAFETLFGESSFVSVLESIQEKMIEVFFPSLILKFLFLMIFRHSELRN